MPTSWIGPTFPNIPIAMALVLVVAVLTGVGIVYALEAADRSFHSAAQIEETTGLAVLGMTLLARTPSGRLSPRNALTASRRMVTEPSSALSESVRLTRAAIAVSRPSGLPRIVMVTSAVPAEGKTTFALMLAQQSAAAGARTIAVEAEMRRPKFGRDLQSLPAKGLADYLMGRATLEQVVGVDEITGMHFIAAGSANQPASELLASARMAGLLKSFAGSMILWCSTPRRSPSSPMLCR